MPRIVIDTNALVAARWRTRSASARILQLCVEGGVQALISDAIEGENRLILGKVRPSQRFMETIESYLQSAERVSNTPEIRAAEDPDDDKYLACAVKGDADAIISSDRHLLDLDPFRDIRIRKPGDFLASLPGT